MASNGIDHTTSALEHTSQHINDETSKTEVEDNEASATSSSGSEDDSDFEDPDDLLTKLRKSTEAAFTLYLIKPMVDTFNAVELCENDVIIAGFPKSGTNWVEQICHQIRTRGSDEDFEELTDEVPLLQLFSVPLGYDLNATQKGDYKLFKTHDVLPHLPPAASQCKTLVLFRNPHNTLSSYYKWEPQFTGYDPRCEVTIEQFFEYKFNYQKTRIPLTYWDFVSTWLAESKTKSNCLIIFYEDLCQDFDRVAEKVRQFLGTTLTKAEMERVKYLSSFEYMKTNESKFDLHGLRKKIADLAETSDYYLEKSSTPSFLNLGAKRNAKNEIPQHLLDIMANEWKEHITDKFGYNDYEEMRADLGGE